MSLRAAGWLLILSCAQFLPFALAGKTAFWGDLTYIHHPWRALAAQMIQAGRLPLWNPYLYFGMPLAAQMQGSAFYPGTILFYLFGFSPAAAAFQTLHYWAAGFFVFLALRRAFPAQAALAAAAGFCLGGGLMSRMPFLNHLAVLSLMPAFLLLFERPGPLAAALALAFLAGYPPFLPGAVVAIWALRLLAGARIGRAQAAAWGAAAVGALSLSAVLLLPAAELASLCRRTGGMALEETLRFGYGPADLVQWLSPLLVPWRSFNPAVEWWKCSYLGLAGAAAALLGFLRLSAARRAGFAAFLVCVLILILGDSNPLSYLAWAKAAPLRFVRYPGNMFYLALPAVAFLTAAGAKGRGWIAFGLVAAELSIYGWTTVPRAPSALFTTAGPLVRRLQAELGEGRYLLSPLALHKDTGTGLVDWKTRLYGLTNAPFRLRAAGNFGEPLVPRASYDLMDALFSAKSAGQAAALFSWADISVLMTPAPVSPSPLLAAEDPVLWSRARARGPSSRAWWFDRGADIPAGLPSGPVSAPPLSVRQEREDRFEVSGDLPAPGWAYVSEPRYPGWKIVLESREGASRRESVPAVLAFQKVEVPSGPWRLHFLYEPDSFRAGLLLTLVGLMALFNYWYNLVASPLYASP